MVTSPQIYYWKNDNIIWLRDQDGNGLKNELNGEYIPDAAVTAVVKFKSGVAVTGQSWPLNLTYVEGSNGVYNGILDKALEVVPGDKLDVEVTVLAPGDLDAFFKIPTIVRQRGKQY